MSITTAAAPLDVQRLRDDFPILSIETHGGRPLVYLDNAATTQRPRLVIDAISRQYESTYANVHRGSHWLSDESTDLYENARARMQQFIGAAEPHEVIFTAGTTAAVNLVARSWGDANLKAGDEVLLTVMEHHSNIVPWQQLAERTGCTLRFATITEDGRLDMEDFRRLLSDQTRLVSVGSVSNMLGVVNPVQEIVAAAHDAGAVVMVDAAQSVPHMRTDVRQWDADFVAFSGHKMLGPGAVGVLYGKEWLLDEMPPFLGGGSMIGVVTQDHFTPAALPAKFEAGTPPIVDAAAMTAAIDYLEEVGLEAIHRHELELVEHAHHVLGEIDGLVFYGPEPAAKSGIVTFNLAGIHANDAAQLLDQQGIAIRAGHHCTMPLHQHLGIAASCRASFYLYNTKEEVDRLAGGLNSARKVLGR